MASHKKSAFPQSEQDLATFAKALSHPARVSILKYLASQSNCVCGDIVDELPLAQSTVSQHLNELKTAGLIKGTIEGPKTCYCINAEKLEQMHDLLNDYLNSLKTLEKQKCC